MIFPILSGILSPRLIPVTYLLIAFNLLVFALTFENYTKSDSEMGRLLKDEEYLRTQGLIFSQMIRSNQEIYPLSLRKMSDSIDIENLSKGTSDRAVMLGYVAFRHAKFVSSAADFATVGDPVAIESWKKKFDRVLELHQDNPLYSLGLSQKHQQFSNFLSYQFTHSGWIHLLWNLTFLLIFGGYVEKKMGYHWLVGTYLCSGLVGGLAYKWMSGLSASPLVGASGSVCGMMALTVLSSHKAKAKFWYWLLPLPGYYGFANFPIWIIFPLFVLPDFAGVLAAVEEIGFAVAHSAHLGGTALGAIFGLLWYKMELRVTLESRDA